MALAITVFLSLYFIVIFTGVANTIIINQCCASKPFNFR